MQFGNAKIVDMKVFKNSKWDWQGVKHQDYVWENLIREWTRQIVV